jgi:hypothetical protein
MCRALVFVVAPLALAGCLTPMTSRLNELNQQLSQTNEVSARSNPFLRRWLPSGYGSRSPCPRGSTHAPRQTP